MCGCVFMSVLPVCTYKHHVRPWCPWSGEEGIISPGTEVTDGGEQVLGAKPGSSRRASCPLNYLAVSLGPANSSFY